VVPSTLRKPAQKAAPKAAPKAAEAKASAETKAPAVTAAPTPGEIAPKPGEIAPVVARTGRETSMGEVAPTAETKPAENAAGTPAPAATQAPSEDGSRATTVTPENEAGTPAPKPASKAVIATEAPAPEAKPKTAAEKRAEAKAKLAGVATTPAPTGDLRAGLTRKAPATPVVEPAKSPAGVRQAAAATQVSAPEALDRTTRRAQLKRELTPVGKNDLSGHVNRVLDQVDSLMQLRRIDEAEAWKQWGEEHRGVIAGTKTRGADLADTMSKRAGGRGIERDIDASAVAREDTQRGGAEATERKVIEDAAPDDREPVANAAESETERDETAQGRPDSEDAPGEAGEAGETSEGQVAAYNPDQERELSKGSNTTRVGERALEAVQQGTQTPEEAMHAFGAKASGSGGAARSHNMLSDYVADRIAHYSDPATAERLRAQIDKLNEAKQALPTRQGAGRDAATQKHSAITAKIAAAEAELERTRPEHVAELRDIHDEMKQHADAVQEAADKAAQETRTQSKETKAVAAQHGLQPKTVEQMRGLVPSIRDTATVRALHAIEDAHAGGNSDPASMARIAKANGVSLADIQRFHDKLSAMPAEDVPKVKALLREAYPPVAEPKIYRRAKSETAGASRVMRQPLLDAIRTGSDDHEYSSGVPLHDLLRSIVDNQDARTQSPVLHDLARRLLKLAPDIPVFDERHFDRLGLDEDEARNTHGVYVPEHDSIAIDTSGATPDTLQTVLHEALHSVTARYLADAEEGKSGAYRALQAIGSELYTAMQNDPTGALLHGLTADDIHYALSDLHELHTMLMTNPSVQAAMARLPASDTLKAALKREGYGPMRTLWDGFRNWVRKAVGLGANSDTLLDHALHVGTGIMDEAHIYDGLARRTAEPGRMLLKATAGSDRDVWDALRAGGSAVRDRMANLGDSARKVVLNGTTFDAMHDWNKELFEPGRTAIIGNAFTRLRDAMRGEVARRGEFAGRYGSKFSDISDRGRKLSREDDQRMGQLMVDATIAKARLGTDAPDLHKHLKTADERAALADVQARFDALPKDQQQLYRDTRDFYDQTYTAERNARLDAITRAALPGATEDQLTALRGVIRNNAKLDAFLASNTDPALEKAFGPGWGTKRGIARAIGKLHGMGRVQGDYFPLRRTGDYIVTHGDRENPRDYHVEMFEKRSDAEDRRAALAEAGRPDVSPVKIKGENTMRDIVPDSQVLRDLDSALRADPALKGHAEAVGDIARQIAMEHATRGEQTRTRMSRKGVLGANAEWRRNLAREYGGATGRYASMKQAPAKAQALADMRTIIADLGSPGRPEGAQIRAQAVFDEAQKRVGAGNDAQTQLSGASRWMNNFGYIQTLMSLSHMATNTLELHTTAGGLLASRYGSRGAFALAKAMREVAPGMTGKMGGGMLKAMSQGLRDADWHMADYARDQFIRAGADKDRTTRLFDAVRESGLIDHSFSKEAKRIAEGGTADGTNRANRLFNRVMDFNGIGQHALDVANKSAVLKAAYDLEYAKNGGDHDAAAAHAIDVISKSTPNYQAYNKASIASARGPLGALGVPLMQFRNYGIHMTNVLTVLARQAAHGDKESMKALAGVIGLHALTAGVFAGTPVGDLLRYGGGAYDMANGAKEPHDYEAAGRRHLSDWLGPEIGELVSRGLPHALGIDVHRRVGLSNMLEMPDLQSFDAKGFATALGKMATPASIGDVGDIFAGASKLIQDHDPSGLSALLPREFRDVSKAVQLARKGVTTQTGKPVLGADKLGTGDIIAQGLGFQPSRVSEAREGRATMMETIREEGEARGKLIKAFTEASDAGDRSAVRAKVNAYNAEHRQRPITMSQLLQAKQKGSTTVGTFGVKVPKGSQAAQSGRFANVQ
jgi:DNA-binding transcriptional MerR regulator